MELRDLNYFLVCLEEGHMTRAAQRLHIAQPTLSHALARLEEELGDSVFERPKKGQPGLRVTQSGRILAEHARRALREVSLAKDEVDASRGLVRGDLRVGSMQTLNSTLLPRPLASFALAYPEVNLSLHTHAAEQIPAALREGSLDLGLIAGAPPYVLAELSTKRLRSEELVLIVRRDHPLAEHCKLPLASLAAEKFVLVLPGTFTSGLILAGCQKAGFVPHALLHLESGEAIREVVRSGLGITILPAGYLNERDRDLRAIELVQPRLKRDVWVVWQRDAPLSGAAKAFVKVLTAEA